MTTIGIVAIGRNEGARLLACLASLAREKAPVVYVDSGSTDGSVAAAERAGADVVLLDLKVPFTAARARNAGLARLRAIAPEAEFVQFIDGDCELREGWISAACAHLGSNPDVAVVCGRRRERHPEASVYNRFLDAEWDTPVGDAAACGGDALMRISAIAPLGGYRNTLIAGEEPELCLRLREAGWRIVRLDAEMTLHDAAITKFSQWWRRAKRAGHAYAEVCLIHRASAHRIWMRETVRALLWSALLPATILAGIARPLFLLLLLAFPAQFLRLLWRARGRGGDAPAFAALTLAAKFAEAAGVANYAASRLFRRPPQLIEYKT